MDDDNRPEGEQWQMPDQIPNEIKELYRHQHCIYPHPKDDAVEQALDRLVIKLHDAGRLLTREQVEAREDAQYLLNKNLLSLMKERDRLKAENERLRGLIKRIRPDYDHASIDTLREIAAELGEPDPLRPLGADDTPDKEADDEK